MTGVQTCALPICNSLEPFTGTFDVPASGIIEADVIVFSPDSITSVETKDPDGNILAEAPDSYTVTGDEHSLVLRIFKPKPGTWTVTVQSAEGNYKTYVVKMYGLYGALSAEWNQTGTYPGCTLQDPYAAKVTLTPMYQGAPYTDPAIMSSSNVGTVTYTNQQTGDTGNGVLEFDGNNSFVGYFPVKNADYSIEAQLHAQDISLDEHTSLHVDRKSVV